MLVSFTIFIHREVSNDDRCGVSWGDERYSRGGRIATRDRHRVSRSDASRAAGRILAVCLSFFGLRGRGGGRGGSVLLVKLLLLEGSDVNHRVGVDFALGGGTGGDVWSASVADGYFLAFTDC